MGDEERAQATDLDLEMLHTAVLLARSCPPSTSAFSVGALVVDEAGAVLATGYSREDDPRVHAEERALGKLDAAVPAGVTMYSSLEPCSSRASRTDSCASLIIAAGIGRVVFALREPAVFVEGRGSDALLEAGVTVVEVPRLAGEVRDVNAHLLG